MRYKFLTSMLLIIFLMTYYLDSYSKNISNCLNFNDTKKETSINWPNNTFKQGLDNDYWLSVEDISKSSQKNIIWVDVRSKKEQKEQPLTFINLSIDELESANFLFNKNVVLVGTGFDQVKLNKAIKHLRKVGFQHVFALYGGSMAWYLFDRKQIDLMDEITPEQFLLGGKTIPWKVVTIALTKEDIEILPEQPIINLLPSDQISKNIIRLISDNATLTDDFISYVFIATDRKTTYQLNQQLKKIPLVKKVVWLQGGVRNYQKYIKQQQRIIANTGHKLSRPCGLAF